MSAPKVISLMGATATGKTGLAVEIARRFPVELISVDSALIYRGMDIGTAKPDNETLAASPHFLIDIIDPAEYYSAWDFVSDSRLLIAQIHARGNMPLLVGGTMMYHHAFEHGLNDLPAASPAIRQALNSELERRGSIAMHGRLARIDPLAAARIKSGDTQRIQRALEVFEVSGKTLSQLQQRESVGFAGKLIKIILQAEDRNSLHARIEARFRDMLSRGLIAEVDQLKQRADLNLALPSMRCVGYRQVWQYLDGVLSYAEMTERGIIATRQLAKRQITWLRKQPQRNAYDCLNYRIDAIFRLLEGWSKDL